MDFVILVVILVVFYVISYLIESSHLAELAKQEKYYAQRIAVNNLRKIPQGTQVQEVFLCCGGVVIAANYYDRFVAKLKQIIGGHLKKFEIILDRAYREATLRMIKAAEKQGAQMVINVRFETSCIGRTDRKGQAGGSMLEVVAYGTAVKLS